MHNLFNSPPKGGLVNSDINNNNSNSKDLKYSESKLPFFLSLILNLLNSFLQNTSSENLGNSNFNNKQSKALLNINNIYKRNLIKTNKFNPMEDAEFFEPFYNLIEKSFYFMQEILSNEKEIIGKLLKANAADFAENDFNDNLYKFFLKAEVIALNDIINFILKILFFRKTEKTLKNRIIYFYFEHLEKILSGRYFNADINKKDVNYTASTNNNIDNKNLQFLFNEETFSKNLFFKDENLLMSVIVLTVEALSEQFNSKAEEYFSQLPNVLVIFKGFVCYLQRNKDNLLKISQMPRISYFFEKGNKLISALEEKLKQKRIVDDCINKIISEEKNMNS